VPTSTVTAAGDMAHQNPSRTEKVPVRAVCRRECDPLASVVHQIADDRHDASLGRFRVDHSMPETCPLNKKGPPAPPPIRRYKGSAGRRQSGTGDSEHLACFAGVGDFTSQTACHGGDMLDEFDVGWSA
jgi:hypothetical protein